MTDQYAKLQKSIDGVAAAVKTLEKSAEKTGRNFERDFKRQAFDVDALTSEEVSELKSLVDHGSDLAAFSSARIKEGGEKVKGMYAEFSRLGLVFTEVNGAYVLLSPMAHWAVEKHEQRARDRKDDTRKQWRHDFCVALASAFFGGVLGIAGALLGVYLGWQLGIS